MMARCVWVGASLQSKTLSSHTIDYNTDNNQYFIYTMRPSLALEKHRIAIREIALRHRVRNVRIFGSVLHGEDTEESDLDILVDPLPDTTLMDIAKIQLEVAQLLKVNVDVLTPNALPDKFREQVVAEAIAV
jgi:predicted nucleotidyltransferase